MPILSTRPLVVSVFFLVATVSNSSTTKCRLFGFGLVRKKLQLRQSKRKRMLRLTYLVDSALDLAHTICFSQRDIRGRINLNRIDSSGHAICPLPREGSVPYDVASCRARCWDSAGFPLSNQT